MPTKQFYINDERYLKLQLIAKKTGKTIPELLGEAVDRWIDEQEPVPLKIGNIEQSI